MKHCRFPVILTDPLPQPWATIDSRLPDRNIPDPPFLKGQSYFCALMNILQPYNSTNNSLNPIHFDNTHLNGTTWVEASSKLAFIYTINVTFINGTSLGHTITITNSSASNWTGLHNNLTIASQQLDYDATNVTVNWGSIIRKEPRLCWSINGTYEPNTTIPGNIPIFINDSWHILLHMSPRYYQLRKPYYYYFDMYNMFLLILEYMNMLFQYEQVNITMYACASHGDNMETVHHDNWDCELEVISFQGALYPPGSLTILLFRNFLSLLIYMSTLPVLLSILLFYKEMPIGLNATGMELEL
jgi:hypothetical protein